MAEQATPHPRAQRGLPASSAEANTPVRAGFYALFGHGHGVAPLRQLHALRDRLPPDTPVVQWRLCGRPLACLGRAGLTEFLFRLAEALPCPQGLGERWLDLTAGEVDLGVAALLRGLGFGRLRIAPEPGDPAALARALAAVREVGIAGGVILHLPALHLASTADKPCEDWFADLRVEGVDLDAPLTPRDLDRLAALARRGFAPLAGDALRRADHPDFALLRAGRLARGPWGFHERTVSCWVALGPDGDALPAPSDPLFALLCRLARGAWVPLPRSLTLAWQEAGFGRASGNGVRLTAAGRAALPSLALALCHTRLAGPAL
ncbi:MAG: hypothetical protein KatS3mg124_0863 [Porticoccaceae bacterium]|nr:MAG: hypothetical protein KatS3mg124_0863 [Porticoccaceae bacterium]